MYNRTNTTAVRFLFPLLLMQVSGVCGADSSKPEVPSAAKQKETAAVLEEVFELSTANTKTKKQELVPKLMKVADDAVKTKDFDQLYAILQATFPAVRDTGDFSTFATAMEMLTSNFAVDSRKEWSTRLGDFLTGCESAAAFEAVVAELLPIADCRSARGCESGQ
ncbi:MAG: hypothetical protein ABI614_26590 [Planctomycetota bacterium]